MTVFNIVSYAGSIAVYKNKSDTGCTVLQYVMCLVRYVWCISNAKRKLYKIAKNAV